MIDKNQLNPFEIKAEIANIISKLSDVTDFENHAIHFRLLDTQLDKEIIVKLLFKEISNTNVNQKLIKFLLMRYCPEKELIEKLWEVIKNNLSSNNAKIFALDLLRDIDSGWTYEDCGKYLDNPEELIDSDTKKILDNAINNPEVQIDFLDFLRSVPDNDKVILMKSLADDYSNDELANLLIPVFLSMSDTETGRAAPEILGNSKSRLAYHALNNALEFADETLSQAIKKNLSILKLAGIRQDNSIEFYKELLKDTKPYKCCITYPDGQGNQAVIISRINKFGKIRFVAVVIDDYKGVRDCFGFNEISQFECNTIIERFYRGERALNIEPDILKSLLNRAEKLSKNKIPYEYICWKNILADIEPMPLRLNYKAEKLTQKVFEKILQYDFMDYWFLDKDYSDEYQEFLEIIDKTSPDNYEKIIEENLENVFYKEEYHIWSERILNTALLKHLAKDEEAAQNLYSLYNDKEFKRELFKNILRKSIYEYYFAQQDNEKINAIEDMWVKNV